MHSPVCGQGQFFQVRGKGVVKTYGYHRTNHVGISFTGWQVENVVKLIDEGNTIPFIARYRKEAHGTLDDQMLREIAERLEYLRNLDKRREEVRASIEGQEN